jgi:hypothetical protein
MISVRFGSAHTSPAPPKADTQKGWLKRLNKEVFYSRILNPNNSASAMSSMLVPGSNPVETSALPFVENLFGGGLLWTLVSPSSQMQPGTVRQSQKAPFGFMWPASATVANRAEFIGALFGAIENHIGKVKMQIAANNNLTFIRLFSFDPFGKTRQTYKQGGLYQCAALAILKAPVNSNALSSKQSHENC